MLIASGVAHLGVFLVDDRPWQGPISWRKPATFGLSFGITLATLTWIAARLPETVRNRIALLVLAADSALEVAGITLQAWRGVPSHLNRSTPFDSLVATTLGMGGAVLIGAILVLGHAVLRGPIDTPPSMRLAIRSGYLLLISGLFAGAAMIAVGTVTLERSGPAAAYRSLGVLKEYHGVALTAIFVLPVAAWALERWVGTERRRVAIARAMVLTYTIAASIVLWSDLQSGT